MTACLNTRVRTRHKGVGPIADRSSRRDAVSWWLIQMTEAEEMGCARRKPEVKTSQILASSVGAGVQQRLPLVPTVFLHFL